MFPNGPVYCRRMAVSAVRLLRKIFPASLDRESSSPDTGAGR